MEHENMVFYTRFFNKNKLQLYEILIYIAQKKLKTQLRKVRCSELPRQDRAQMREKT